MKKTLLLACCLSIASNCYAIKNSDSESGTANQDYLGQTIGNPRTDVKVYKEIKRKYEKKNENAINELAGEISKFVCSIWSDTYKINRGDLTEKITEAAPQYLKKWRRQYVFLYTPKENEIESKKLSKVQNLLKKSDSGLNGRVWEVSTYTADHKKYIIEMIAEHNIFKTHGKNITFKIYKSAD